ncbi:MAG: carbohydrate kinase family protein [Patescibacteria group bacterium]
MKRFDVIAVGGSTRDFFMYSGNYDVSGNILKLPWGEKVVAENLIKEVGGGGCNGAVSFARAGLKTSLLTKVGNDSSGENVAHRLKDEGIDLGLLKVIPGGTTSTSFILCNRTGEHAIVMYRGKNDEFTSSEINWNELSNTGWIYLADITAEQGDLSTEITQFAKENDIRLAFIPGQHQLKLGVEKLKPVLAGVDVMILNAFEAATLLEKTSADETLGGELEMLDYLLQQFSALGVKTTVITADIHGARAFDAGKYYFQPAPRVEKTVNTTGAGDAFASAFVASRIKEIEPEDGLKKAAENAGAVLGHLGAQTGLTHWR